MKKVIALIMVLMMVVTLLPVSAFADTAPTFSVESNWAMPGSTVNVDVKVKNNPGLISTNLVFSLPDGVAIVGATAGDAFSALTMTAPAQLGRGEEVTGTCRFAWFSSDIDADDIKDGIILSLEVKIAEDAQLGNELAIGISSEYGDSLGKDGNPIQVQTVGGNITVIDYTPGDVNQDGRVNMQDVVLLSRYIVDGCTTDPNGYNITLKAEAADINADGRINMQDVVNLSRYIVDNCKTDPNGYNIKPLPAPTPCAHANMEHYAAKAASCTEDGNIEYWHCAKCDKYFTDAAGNGRIALSDTVLSALGHDVVIDPAVEPTYTSTGLTEGSHCARCNEVLVKQIVIPKLVREEYAITYNIVNSAEHPYLATVKIDTSALDTSYTPGKAVKLRNLDLGEYGYTFDGWYDGFGKNATQIKEIPASATGNIELYAHVTENEYEITYNLYQTPVTSSPTEKQTHYTVSKGNSNLYNPDINNYKFLGWYDDNGVEYKTIPVGTTGDITLNAYYTSLRNLAISKEDNNPIIVEDQNENVVYFTYEIGEIRNIPLNGDNPFWSIQSVAGLSQAVSETYTTTMSSDEAKTVSSIITGMTTNSNTWTMSKSWNDVTTVNQTWAESKGKTTEQCKTEATTASNTLSLSDQMGGSSYHKTEDGTTVYDYDTKTTTKDKGHQFDIGVNGTYTNKFEANIGASTEYGASDSYGYTQSSKDRKYDHTSADSAKDVLSSGAKYENGYEINGGLKYGYHNNTNTVTKTGTDTVSTNSNIDENTSNWNASANFSSTLQHSSSQSIRNTLSDIVTTTKGYGSSYSKGGTDTSSQGFSSTESNTEGTTSSVTYSKLESKTTTQTYSVDGKIEGSYRSILVGKAHVFGVVGYDYAKKSFFTYTFSVMDDKVEEFLDYTPKGGSFDDCEYSCLPFEIPFDVYEYVTQRTSQTTGIKYITDSVNGTATITGYSGESSDVIIPSYVSDGKQAYKVTAISSNAFAGKSIRSIVIGEFINTIPNGAFKNCTALEEVIGSFTEIGNEAFAGCSNLTNMNIPSNVVKIGTNAFKGANSINVRAINQLSSYAEAKKMLPDGTDEQLVSKQKAITQEFIKAILDSGANNIVLDLSYIADDTTLNLEIGEIESIEIKGGSKTYNGFTIDSAAKRTTLSEMTINTDRGTPIKVGSDKLELHKVFVNAKNLALLLKKDGAVLYLIQDSAIKTNSEYAIIGKNLVIDSQKRDNGATGFLTVSGNIGYVNSINGIENVKFISGKESEITDEEFNKYILGQFVLTFDANGGTASENTRVCYYGTATEALPVPERTGFTFDGWYTAKDGGSKIDANAVSSLNVDCTLYAHWTANGYTVKWNDATGAVIAVERTASPYVNAKTGTLASGDTVYYGDVLSVKYTASAGYTIDKTGVDSITVVGDVTSDDIFASATPNSYTYNIVYKSSNGTNLGTATATYKYGTTNTISPPAKTGYNSPAAQSVKWDSVKAKTITFTYTPQYVSTSQQAASGQWWYYNNSTGITYSVQAQYQNRTASTVQIRLVWNQTITRSSYYGYAQYFYASCGGQNTGNVTIASSSTWSSSSSSARTVTAYSGWMTVPVSATSTSAYIACDWWTNGTSDKGSWGKTISIPAY